MGSITDITISNCSPTKLIKHNLLTFVYINLFLFDSQKCHLFTVKHLSNLILGDYNYFVVLWL